MLRLFVLLVALLGCTVAQHVHIIPEGYKYGEVVNVECRGADGQWGAPLVCIQTGQPMSFKYGIDSFQHCGVAVDDELYGFFSKLIKRDAAWDCRVSGVPGENQLHVPFYLPVWGIEEADHMHVDNHINIIFHAAHGRIIGVTAYPVRDMFQPIGRDQRRLAGTAWRPSSGSQEARFHPLSPHSHDAGGGVLGAETRDRTISILRVAFMAAVLAFAFSLMVATCVYRCLLRPRLVKGFMKMKQQ